MLSMKGSISALSRFAKIAGQTSRSIGNNVHEASRVRSPSSYGQQQSLRSAVQTMLQKLQRSLDSPATASIDRILESLQSLHEMKVPVPLSYFMDTASILCERNDPVRAELLIHLCRDNIQLARGNEYDKEMRNDPVDKLVSYAVSGLLRNGNGEAGSQFWVRMTNSGFKSNRVVMESMLDTISENHKSTPSLEFVNSLHAAMQVHLWDQSSGYYGRILKVLRRHLESQCHSGEKMLLGLNRLESLWTDAEKSIAFRNPAVAGLVRLPPELYALRLSCYAVAMKTLSSSRVPEVDRGPVLLQCQTEAKKAFESYLQSLTSTSPAQSVSGDDGNIRDLVQEMRTILRAHLTPDEVARIDEAGERGAGSERTNKATYMSFNEAKRDMRQATGLFLTELARQGCAQDAAGMLSRYITAWERHDGDAQIQAGERDWQRRVACAIMRESRVVRLVQAPLKGSSGGDGTYAQAVFQELRRTFEHIKQTVLVPHQLNLIALFYASFIDAVTLNMFQLQLLRAEGKAPGVVAWPEAIALVEDFLSGCPARLRGENSIRHATVALLCQSSGDASLDAQGVYKALEMVKGGDRVTALTLCEVLEGATQSLDDAGLSYVLSEVEAYADRHMRRMIFIGAKNDGVDQTTLLRARIFAHCRLREGHRALQLLRVWKNGGGRVEARVYRWIIHALHQASPDGDVERAVASNPSATISFLMQEMERDGLTPSAQALELLLRLYTKAVQVSPGKELKQQRLQEMDELAASYGGKANRQFMSEDVLREMVKARCVAGMSVDAQQLIINMEKALGVKATARCYEPLIFQRAVLEGKLNAAEDMLMGLVNAAMPLTDLIVSSFVAGLMRYGELSEALDTVQDMYNQHQVRPPVTVWTALLDASLARGDVHEARRVVFLLKQLYTAEERAKLVGPAVSTAPLPASAGTPSTASPPATSDGAAFLVKLGSVRASEKGKGTVSGKGVIESKRRQKSISYYWNPPPQAATTGKNGAPASLLPAYLLKVGVPVGLQQRGALSDEALALRFSKFNLVLK